MSHHPCACAQDQCQFDIVSATVWDCDPPGCAGDRCQYWVPCAPSSPPMELELGLGIGFGVGVPLTLLLILLLWWCRRRRGVAWYEREVEAAPPVVLLGDRI